MASYTPAKSSFSRVFLVEGGARADREPEFQSCLVPGSLEQSFGDTTNIECPDPDTFGKFEVIGELEGATERPTTSLTGRYAADLKSTLLEIAKKRRKVDIFINIGATTTKNPGDFDSGFNKLVLVTNAKASSVSTDELGAIESGNAAPVNETAEISGDDWVEIMGLTMAERAAGTVVNEVIDITGSYSTGGDNFVDWIFALTKTAPGSPSTPADVVYSRDGGANWYWHDVDSLSTNEPDGIAILGTNVVVVSNASGSLHYAPVSDFKAGIGDPTFTEVSTGVVTGGEPNDIWSVGTKAFVVGDAGYVYATTDASAGLTVLDAGSATAVNLNCVHAASKTLAMAGGQAGEVIYTTDGVSWSAVQLNPVGVTENITACWMVDATTFWVGTSAGKLYYTLDAGESWTLKGFSGSGSGVVHDIAMALDNKIMYVSHATTAPAGRILRSYNAGNSFVVLPEGTATLPANDRVTALFAPKGEANVIFGGGLADDGSDGFLVRGIA